MTLLCGFGWGLLVSVIARKLLDRVIVEFVVIVAVAWFAKGS